MFGKGVHQEEEALLRDIVRSINKKLIIQPVRGKAHGLRFISNYAAMRPMFLLIWETSRLLETIWLGGIKFAKKSKLDTITSTNHGTVPTS